MFKEEVKIMVEMHNKKVDNFVNNTLPVLLESKGVKIVVSDNGEYKIPMEAWFTAQSIINTMNFYDDAMQIINLVKPFGYNVKVNMQTNKLVF